MSRSTGARRSPQAYRPGRSRRRVSPAAVLLAIVIIAVEFNALAGPAAPATGAKKILATLNGTFWAGFILSFILYFVLAALFGG